MIKWLEDASSSVVVAIFPGVRNYSEKENDVIEVRGLKALIWKRAEC
ncbi:MAG: hypothetical protein H0Z30_02595 [Candidatus Marinimicrobia bacterium]|nr:hypothetical protein [Candidatus Neomarinimicrobiota bacterium]